MDEKSDPHLKLVNASGFVFQLRLEAEVARTADQHGWTVGPLYAQRNRQVAFFPSSSGIRKIQVAFRGRLHSTTSLILSLPRMRSRYPSRPVSASCHGCSRPVTGLRGRGLGRFSIRAVRLPGSRLLCHSRSRREGPWAAGAVGLRPPSGNRGGRRRGATPGRGERRSSNLPTRNRHDRRLTGVPIPDERC